MNGTAASLALVMADTGASEHVAAQALDAACAQLREGDGLAWVSDRRPPVEHAADAVWEHAPRDASRGELYGLGLEWASSTACGAVAFTDSGTQLDCGWRSALDHALARGADVIGGPVVPGSGARPAARRTNASWAGFLVEYAAHAVPPYVSASGDFSANNIGYRLELVARYRGLPFWKSVVDRELRDEGHRLELAPSMIASSLRDYSSRDLTIGRWAAGRLYGSQIAPRWPARRRVLRALACLVLPAVRLLRLARSVHREPVLRSRLRRSAAVVAVAELAWSAGEACGYLLPQRPPRGVR